MTKAKPIDRLELTRRKFANKYHAENIASADEGLKICPVCGLKSLRLDGGCMSCLSCGWSACG